MKINRRNPFESRLRREFDTITAMVGIYCESRHGSKDELCNECTRLLDYAESRIEFCPFGTSKPQCTKCEIHCYSDTKRNDIKQVMRFSGPRMLWKHPLKTILHYADALRDGSREKARKIVLEKKKAR